MLSKCFTNHIYQYKKSLSIQIYSKVASKSECSIFNHENQTKPNIENVHMLYIHYMMMII